MALYNQSLCIVYRAPTCCTDYDCQLILSHYWTKHFHINSVYDCLCLYIHAIIFKTSQIFSFMLAKPLRWPGYRKMVSNTFFVRQLRPPALLFEVYKHTSCRNRCMGQTNTPFRRSLYIDFNISVNDHCIAKCLNITSISFSST